jgi:hypothetical protein
MRELVVAILLSLSVNALPAQDSILFVAAKNGLSLRAKPSVSAQVISKLTYGQKVVRKEYVVDTGLFTVEGFESEWIHVSVSGKEGFVASAFLFPVIPPMNNVKTIKDYLNQVSKAVCTVEYGERSESAEDNYDARAKVLYKNGAEVLKEVGYEWASTGYVLPGFDIQSAFHLLRLIPEFSGFVNPNTIFPMKSTKSNDVEIKVFREDNCDDGFRHCIQKIKFYSEKESIDQLQLLELNGEVYIIYESGV